MRNVVKAGHSHSVRVDPVETAWAVEAIATGDAIAAAHALVHHGVLVEDVHHMATQIVAVLRVTERTAVAREDRSRAAAAWQGAGRETAAADECVHRGAAGRRRAVAGAAATLSLVADRRALADGLAEGALAVRAQFELNARAVATKAVQKCTVALIVTIEVIKRDEALGCLASAAHHDKRAARHTRALL